MRLSQLRRSESGATAVEFAIIALALILVCIGTIEFGRGLQLRNELSFAADFGARKVLLELTDCSQDLLAPVVHAAFTEWKSEFLDVTIGTETADGAQFCTINLSYPFTALVPGLSGEAISLSLARRVPI